MIIRFRYRIPLTLADLMHNTIINYYEEYINGMLDDGLVGDLKHCSLYMLCPSKIINDKQVNENPVAIVAHNTEEAMQYFFTEFEIDGYVVAEIESRCDKITVEPV